MSGSVTRFLVRRLLSAILIVFLVSSASVILTRLTPGDFVTDVRGVASPETAARLRARYGLDRSVGAQYVAWLGAALRFDFGESFAYSRPVSALVPERAANTAMLALAALAVATFVGIPLGVVAGSRRGGLIAALIRAASSLLLSLPPLLTSLLLIFVAAQTGWLPTSGMRSATTTGRDLVDLGRHMIVPVLALALPIAATFERLQAQATREMAGQRFFLAARARGIPPWRLVWRDGLRPSLVSVLSVYGLVVGSLLSGSFAVEIISAWPGLGRLMLDALRARDLYLVAGCAAAGSVFLAAGTLVADVALVLLDPRVRE